MNFRGRDGIDQLPTTETAEDVAALYAWANLHGAKYRDFSASRREYRAHLRSKAAEQMRESKMRPTKLSGRVDANRGAGSAGASPACAQVSIGSNTMGDAEPRGQSKEQGSKMSESVERMQPSQGEPPSVPGTVAGPTPTTGVVSMPEAQRSALRQAVRAAGADPDVSRTGAFSTSSEDPRPGEDARRPGERAQLEDDMGRKTDWESRAEQSVHWRQQLRPEGYHPDDASGVREIYREASRTVNSYGEDRRRGDRRAQRDVSAAAGMGSEIPGSGASTEERETGHSLPDARGAQGPSGSGVVGGQGFGTGTTQGAGLWSSTEDKERNAPERDGGHRPVARSSQMAVELAQAAQVLAEEGSGERDGVVGAAFVRPAPAGPWRGRRDGSADSNATAPQEVWREPKQQQGRDRGGSGQRPAAGVPAGANQQSATPAWLYEPQPPKSAALPSLHAGEAPLQQSSVADTLQYSRERVASRWFALKGVFEQPGVEKQADPVQRQKEIRTPVLAVFSLAGGVGKTSIVATLGRSLSALGEKVLLADTTSHGLLPYYFGASELRQGVVRTFSPPSGSTDAPIYLVSYDVEQHGMDEASQEALIDEIVQHGKGTHRIMLDLAQGSGWIAQRMMKLNPTVLVPVAADMNSVITLQAVEKFLQWTTAPDGQPVRPYYLLNQFDAALPLHLDVREVLRRQLGDRLLPFVIRRSHAVSESLAEGMTVLDYSPDSPVVEDYQTLATWLRNVSAPATAGFRNVRWSER